MVYSGARLGEVCGLRIQDVREIEGIPYIALRDHKDRELKRAASVRDVPLHPELIRLGFLEFVRAMEAEGEEFLFPELYSSTGRPMATAYVELIGKFLKLDFAFMREGELTHGIRHFVNDQLRLAEVTLELRQALIGHRGEERLEARRNSVRNLKRLQEAQALLPNVTAHVKPAAILLHPPELRGRRIRKQNRGAA